MCGAVAGSLLWSQMHGPEQLCAGGASVFVARPSGEENPHTPNEQEPVGPVYTINVALASNSMVAAPVKTFRVLRG
jgi:hypothetical protein